MPEISKQKLKEIIDNRPTNTTPQGILNSLRSKGYTFEGYGQAVKPTQTILPQTPTPQPKQSFLGGLVQGAKNIVGDVQKRFQGAVEATTKGVFGEGNPVEAALQTVGQGAGLVGDVLYEGAKAILPSAIKEPIKKGISAIAQAPPVQSVMQGYSDWANKHPEASKDLEAITNIASLIPIGGGGKILEKGVEKAAPIVGKLAEKGAGVLEEKLAKQVSQETLDIVGRDVNIMTKAERETALKAGQVEKPGIFKPATIKVSPQDQEIAQSVQGIVSKSKNPIENIDNIRTKIGEVAAKTETLPKENDAIFNNAQIKSALLQTKEGSSVIFAGDKTLENAYDSVVNEFMKILDSKPNKLSSVLEARKEFDQVIKQKFPKIFDKFSGDNIRANAVKDVRMAANDFVSDSLPEGNQFKALLKEQSNMYRAIDRIAEKAVPSINQSKFAHLTNIIRKHPWLSIEAAGALGGIGLGSAMGMGGAMVGILTNPVALGALALYGTYKIGKSVITSQWLKKGLIEFLNTTSKVLQPEEKSAVQSIIDSLGSKAGLSLQDMSQNPVYKGLDAFVKGGGIINGKPNLDVYGEARSLMEDIAAGNKISENRGREILQLAKKGGGAIPKTTKGVLPQAIPKNLQPLAQEARKYKSAEDRVVGEAIKQHLMENGVKVNADNTVTLYHATSPEKLAKINSEGIIKGGSTATGGMTGLDLKPSAFFGTDKNWTKNTWGQGGQKIIEVKVPVEYIRQPAQNMKEVYFEGGLKKGSDGIWRPITKPRSTFYDKRAIENYKAK